MSNKASRKSRRDNKFFLRIGAIILVVLMLGGTLYSAFALFSFDSSAAYDEYAIHSATASTAYLTVGIVYGSDSPTAYPIRSPSGFVIGSVYADNDQRIFSPLFSLPQTTLTPAVDANVSKSLGEYQVTDEYYQTKIGAFHIQLTAELPTEIILQLIEPLNQRLAAIGQYAFPAYINGMMSIRVGDFAAYEQTLNALPLIQPYLADFKVDIVSPSATAISLIDPATDHVAFEYDCGENYYLGLTPIQNGGTEQNYLQTPADNLYEGVFAAKRYTTGSIDGVTIFNLIDLEGYVEGVLPYEVGTYWPAEALRAFAIASRSYALAYIGHHYKAYGFDLCTHHCQAYRGRVNVNDAVIQAVSSTAGEVLSYNGKVVRSFYSSSNGGESIPQTAAWGGSDAAYTIAQKTPWERYSEHSNGVWVKELSPSVLASNLNTNLRKYYKVTSKIAGDVASIQVAEYAADGSNYIKSLLVTDVYGNTETLNTTEKIQLTLGVNSANFTIGRGSLTYTYHEVQSITVSDRIAGLIPVQSKPGEYNVTDYITAENHNILGVPAFTGSGTVNLPTAQMLPAFTGSGLQVLDGNAKLLTGIPSEKSDESYTVFSDPDPVTGLITAQTVHGNTVITTVLKPIVKTYTASSPGNFIFAGKGWGHGVGLSQYGTYDLVKAGAKAETILELYYPKAKIVDYHSLAS